MTPLSRVYINCNHIRKFMLKGKKILCVLLVLAIVFSTIDIGVFARATSSTGFLNHFNKEKERNPRSGKILYEVNSERKKNGKVFRKDDGTYEFVAYKDAVHYQENGVWKEIDNSLQDDETGNYKKNKKNSFNIKFPKKIKENKSITLNNNGVKLKFNILGIKGSDLEVVELGVEEKNHYTKLNNSSKVKYSNIMNNVDIEYLIQGDTLKENIILNDYIDNFEMSFVIDVKDVEMLVTEEGNIEFYKDGKLTYLIEKLFMLDNNSNYSNDIDMSIIKNKKKEYILTIKPSDEWLKNATYPVIIDPTYKIFSGNIYDTYTRFDMNNPKDEFTNYAGSSYIKLGIDDTYSTIMEGFIKFNLPSTLSGKLLTYSDLSLYVTSRSGCPTEGCKVNASRITSNWYAPRINASNAPSSSSTITDYQFITSTNKMVTFDITDVVKYWEANGGYYGIKLELENPNQYVDFASSENSNSSIKPIFHVGYVDNTGLEDYWTYHSQSLGEAGTGYVNDATGDLTWTLPLYTNPTLRTPFTISFVHNSNNFNTNIGYGNGWRTNLNERIGQDQFDDGDSNIYYRYIDGDGTKKYFIDTSCTDFGISPGIADSCGISEDGSFDYAIFGYYSSAYSHEIVMKDGTIKKFDNYGRLAKLLDINGNDIDIYYIGSSDQIDYVMDTLGNKVDFQYNSGIIDKILLPDGNYYKINYINNQIDYVQLYDKYNVADFKATFVYDSLSQITDVYNSFGNQLNYQYKSLNVTRVEEKNGKDSLGYMSFDYLFKRTKFTDFKGNEVYYSFDTYGHTINILDSYGNAQYYKYSDIFDEDINGNYKLNNKIEEISSPQKNIVNPLNNHSFEFGLDNWSTVIENNVGTVKAEDNCGLFSTESVYGVPNTSCSVLSRNGLGNLNVDRLELRQTVVLDQGTYTVSGYINSDYDSIGGVGAYIDVEGASSKGTIYEIQGSGKWEKYKLQFSVEKDDTNITIVLKNKVGIGKAYFDQIQIDEGFINQRFNYFENSSFENSLSGWSNNGASLVSNNTSGIYNKVLKDKSVKLTSYGTRKYIKQNITGITTNANEVIFGGWFKGDIPHNTNEEVQIILNYRAPDGSLNAATYDINKNINEWQYLMFKFNPYLYGTLLSVEVSYKGYSNLYVDNMQLYIEEFGSSYSYNNDGNIININHPGINNDTSFIYESSNKNDISGISNGMSTTSVTYDIVRRLKTITSANNIKSTFDYDSYGNPTSLKYGNDLSGKWFGGKITYANYGNYIDKIEDEFGNIIDYNHNTSTGKLDSVVDPNGVTTSYDYDDLGRLHEVIKGNSNSIYNYENGKLKNVEVNGFKYIFNYDDLGRLENIQVADMTLIQYIYETYGSYKTTRLDEQIYGNGDSIKFIYNSENQITEMQFKESGTSTYVTKHKYEYDSLGNIAVYKDIVNNKQYYYNYDLSGHLKDVTDELGNTVSYEYDSNTGNTNKFGYNVNGKNREVEYIYDFSKGIYDKTTFSTSNGTVEKDYIYEDTTEGIGRLTDITLKMGATTILNTKYIYADNTPLDAGVVKNGNVSLRVKSLRIGSRLQTFTYDKNGNITSIYDYKTGTTNYYYDSLGQLIREDNPVANKTYVYDYDDYGNFSSKKIYAYTTASTISTPLLNGSAWYYYGNKWKDQVVYRDGMLNGFEYDNSGNPTKINGATLTWEGRQLVSYSIGVSFKYNDQGIRTQKNFRGKITDYYVVGDKVIYEKSSDNKIIYYTYDVDGKIIGFNYNDNDYFYARNLFGDIIEIRDINGNLKVEYEYDAWGNIVKKADYSGINLGNINPYRYRGYRYDEETGWYYLNSRYYNPEIGRFINADGIIGETGEILSHNMYAYCANNPVMRIDPSGYLWKEIWDWGNTIWGTVSNIPAKTIVAVTTIGTAMVQGRWDDLADDWKNGSFNPFNQSE
ncbi:hypothetical protein KHQ81_06130 [Mycoplasmatota bacterium]|nr:hypothetical protein KHQ81_06130 [Mycoplasmatota bacterium]